MERMDAFQIAERIEGAGFEAYFVGGFVRDSIRNVPSNDVDIATNARPNQILSLFADRNPDLVGKVFGVIIVDGVEIATYRSDMYTGNTQKECTVTFETDITKDLSRRDLTINSLSMDLRGNIVDPFNGKSDIENRIIRFVSNADDRIAEDPNRILRACRFVSSLNGKFSSDTFTALVENAYLVKERVSPERIRGEILKAMKTRKASRFFIAMRDIGILEYVFPSMVKCIDHPHGKHHSEDIFTHLMLAGDSVSSRCPLVKLSSYLHDIGKPEVYADDSFIDHESVGSEIAQKELATLKFSNKEIYTVSGLIKNHMRNCHHVSPKGARRVIKAFRENGVDHRNFLRLRFADRKANLQSSDYSLSSMKRMYRNLDDLYSVIADEPTGVKMLAVNGHDVMAVTGKNTGPEIGEILKSLLEKVMDAPELNTRETLISILKGE